MVQSQLVTYFLRKMQTSWSARSCESKFRSSNNSNGDVLELQPQGALAPTPAPLLI